MFNVKRIFYSGISIFLAIFITFVVSKKILPGDDRLKEYDLIFYQANNGLFYKSKGNFRKFSISNETAVSNRLNESDVLKISMLKYNGRQLFFTGEGIDLWKLDFETGSIIKFSEAVKKPVQYNGNLKRAIIGFDEKSEVVLYKHEMIKSQSGQAFGAGQNVRTNFSANERFYSLDSHDKHLYVGTAVNGLYYSTNEIKVNGNISKNKQSNPKAHLKDVTGNPGDPAFQYVHFASMNEGLPFIPFDGAIRFYEEIHALHVSKQGDVFAGIGIQGGVYVKKAGQNRFQSLPWPEKWKISDVYLITTGKDNKVWVSCTQGLVTYMKDGDSYRMQIFPWSDFSFPYKTFLIQHSIDSGLYAYYVNPAEPEMPEKIQRMKTASGKRLFYSSPYNLKLKPSLIKTLLKSNNYDGIVLDVKDDRGQVLYKSDVPFVSEIGALHSIMDLGAFVKMVHEYKKYIAVRVVVFKDPVLFERPGYAIWDSSKDQPWVGNEKERWVDPFNPAVAENYYVPLAKELTSLGVDEIQFDYIRFPSDGPINLCLFRHQTSGKYYSEAIEDFLYQVRQATALPISLDIYGYQGLYRTGGAIGQDMLAFGQFSDVISPMLYSSHFGDSYMTDRKKDERVYELIRHSMRRAEFIARDRFLIRPYLQAFPMRTAVWGYGTPYFLDQIRANKEENGSGYSFWGSLDHMAAVDKAINTLK